MATTSFTKKTLGLETVEPAVTPPPSDATTTFVKKPKLAVLTIAQTRHPGGALDQVQKVRRR